MVEVGKPVPAFEAPATSEQTFRLADHKGDIVVIYFYPKDNTPGCTKEGEAFRDHYDVFKEAGAVIYGVSRDGIKAHENFRAKYSFPFELISDKEEEVCKLFDVIKEKKMYGRVSLGIERSTFIIDREGLLNREWRKVKVAGHAEEVLEAVKALG